MYTFSTTMVELQSRLVALDIVSIGSVEDTILLINQDKKKLP